MEQNKQEQKPQYIPLDKTDDILGVSSVSVWRYIKNGQLIWWNEQKKQVDYRSIERLAEKKGIVLQDVIQKHNKSNTDVIQHKQQKSNTGVIQKMEFELQQALQEQDHLKQMLEHKDALLAEKDQRIVELQQDKLLFKNLLQEPASSNTDVIQTKKKRKRWGLF